jgi:protein TonB
VADCRTRVRKTVGPTGFSGQIQEYIDTLPLNDNNSYYDPNPDDLWPFGLVLKREMRFLLIVFEEELKLGIWSRPCCHGLPSVNEFTLRPNLNSSPATLAMVVIAHVAAALLIVQLFEAKRYVELSPLMVSLLPVPQAPDVAPSPLPQAVVPVPVQEIKREPVPEPVKPEPVREVRHEPKPVERVVVPEPAPERAVEPPPPPPPQSITEVPVPPPPVPVIVAVPEPQPITPAPQVVQTPQEPEEITMTSQMLTAIYLRNPKPSYPNLSRRLSEQGTVLLRVFVTMAGDATRIELKASSGFTRLDNAALNAVQNWKFVPAKRGEQPVAAWVVVPIKFSLKG